MIFNIIFKILYTILGLWTIILYAGLTAILTPNFMLFELSYEYIKLLVFWLTSIGIGCYSLTQMKKVIIGMWKYDELKER